MVTFCRQVSLFWLYRSRCVKICFNNLVNITINLCVKNTFVKVSTLFYIRSYNSKKKLTTFCGSRGFQVHVQNNVLDKLINFNFKLSDNMDGCTKEDFLNRIGSGPYSLELETGWVFIGDVEWVEDCFTVPSVAQVDGSSYLHKFYGGCDNACFMSCNKQLCQFFFILNCIFFRK